MKLANTIQILLCMALTIPLATALQSERIYFLDLEYNKGALKLLDVNLITGFPIVSDDTTLPYKLELLSINKEILYKGYFDIPNKIIAPPPLEPGERSGVVELDNLDFSISLPYYKKGSMIKISKDNEELLIVDVSKFMMYCGDSICQPDENPQICPEDCIRAGELVTIQKETKRNVLPAIIILLTLIVIIALVIYLNLKDNKNRTVDELK